MPAYTTVAKVKADLPSGQPKNPTTGAAYSLADWNTLIGEIITKNSQYVDDNVGGNYPFSYGSSDQKFPDITDDPGTPATIDEITKNLCVAECLGYFSGVYNADDNTKRLRRRDWAEDKLKAIRLGEIQISVAGVNLYTVATEIEYDREEEDLPVMDTDEMDGLW